MTDMPNLNGWRDYCHQEARRNGWYDAKPLGNTFGDNCALLHSEVSEAFEAYRDGASYTENTYNQKKGNKPEGIPSEMADLFIRLMDVCGMYKIDITDAVVEKLNYNRTREKRHGGKLL